MEEQNPTGQQKNNVDELFEQAKSLQSKLHEVIGHLSHLCPRWSEVRADITKAGFALDRINFDFMKEDYDAEVGNQLKLGENLSVDKLEETAPPGLEDMVMALKKKFPSGSDKPFKIAWAHYNREHGKNESLKLAEDLRSKNLFERLMKKPTGNK
jgi:hypothetical protein